MMPPFVAVLTEVWSKADPPPGVDGGVLPGTYRRMEHQLRWGSSLLLLRGLPSTPWPKMGIMSSNVSLFSPAALSKTCTLLRLLSTSASMSGGGVLAMADEMTLGM